MFRAISKYLAKNANLQVFQFENVTALAAKPESKGATGEKELTGPSNLSAVCYVLDREASMWSHVWQVDARDFGSGQQRQRLYGSAFKRQALHMPLESARQVLNDTMNFCSGVRPCHPEEYLLHPLHPRLKAERSVHVLRNLPEKECPEGATSLSMDCLFQTGGVVPSAVGRGRGAGCGKRRRLATPASPPSAKWVKLHATAFRDLGEEQLRKFGNQSVRSFST